MTDAPFTPAHRETLEELSAYLRPEHRVSIRAALAEIARLQAQTKLYGRELDDWAEKEASVCAEDVSFVDRIKWLEAELQQARGDNEMLKAFVVNLATLPHWVAEEAKGVLEALRSAPDPGGEK